MLKDWLVNLAFASVAGAIAGKIVSAWGSNKEAAVKFLQGIDDWVEARTGFNIPDSAQDTYDRLVLSVANRVEGLATNKGFWLRVIKAIRNQKDTTLAEHLLEEVKGLELDTLVWDALSPELRTVVNEVKHEAAAKVLRPLASRLPEPLSEPEVDQRIAQAALVVSLPKPADPAVVPEDHTGTPVDNAMLERLAEESRKRQETLRK